MGIVEHSYRYALIVEELLSEEGTINQIIAVADHNAIGEPAHFTKPSSLCFSLLLLVVDTVSRSFPPLLLLLLLLPRPPGVATGGPNPPGSWARPSSQACQANS